jgi:hypothetical protein
MTAAPDARQLFQQGNDLLDRGEIALAVDALKAAFELDKNLDTLKGVAMAALASQDWRYATGLCRWVCKEEPANADNWHRYGAACWGAGKWAKARIAFLKAVRRDPGHIGAHEQLAAIYGMVGDDFSAEYHARMAVTLPARTPIERFQQSTPQLWLGDYVNGWRNYEERFHLPLVLNGWRVPAGLDQSKRWTTGITKRCGCCETEPHRVPWGCCTCDDGPREGRLLCFAEQGHGDALQLARYFPMILDHCDRLTVLVHGSLVSLFEQQAAGRWDVQALVPGQPAPEHDAFVGAMSLPHIFGTTLETVPAPADFGMRWNQGKYRYYGHGDEPRRIALCTKGGAVASLDLDRSCHDDSFDRLKSLEGYEFVDFTGRTGDYLSTATELLGCELLVTVDTSIAHLAGSLGMPVWLVPPSHFEWRHLRGAEVNPWYKSWRYFRRRKSNDWAYCVEQIIQALEAR